MIWITRSLRRRVSQDSARLVLEFSRGTEAGAVSSRVTLQMLPMLVHQLDLANGRTRRHLRADHDGEPPLDERGAVLVGRLRGQEPLHGVLRGEVFSGSPHGVSELGLGEVRFLVVVPNPTQSPAKLLSGVFPDDRKPILGPERLPDVSLEHRESRREHRQDLFGFGLGGCLA